MSAAKSTVQFFTPDTHEHDLHPQVKLADQVLPLENKPKVLGVTLDTHLTFTQHCSNIAVKVQQLNNVLKALADQYSATAALSGRHHSRTLTGVGFNGHQFQR